jgi:hypothetical protein
VGKAWNGCEFCPRPGTGSSSHINDMLFGIIRLKFTLFMISLLTVF